MFGTVTARETTCSCEHICKNITTSDMCAAMVLILLSVGRAHTYSVVPFIAETKAIANDSNQSSSIMSFTKETVAAPE